MKKLIRIILTTGLMLLLMLGAASAADACPRCGSTKLSASYTYYNAKAHTKKLRCKSCKHSWKVDEAHTAEACSYLAPTCTELGHDAGYACKYCHWGLKGTKTYKPLGHDLYYWDPTPDGMHKAPCRRAGCGIHKKVAHTSLTFVVGGEKHSFCPVCGLYDSTQIYSLKGSTIRGAVKGALTGKTTIVRGVESGFSGELDNWDGGVVDVAYVFTAVRESKGEIVPLKGSCDFRVAVPAGLQGRLLHQTAQGTFEELNYSYGADGLLNFTCDDGGLFLVTRE